MNHHPGRLVDDREIGVLINDIQRNLLGDGFQRGNFRLTENGEGFVAAQTERSFRRIAIHQDLFFSDELLNAGAAGFSKLS